MRFKGSDLSLLGSLGASAHVSEFMMRECARTRAAARREYERSQAEECMQRPRTACAQKWRDVSSATHLPPGVQVRAMTP